MVCGAIITRQTPFLVNSDLHSPATRPSTSSDTRSRNNHGSSIIPTRRSVSRAGGSRIREKLPRVRGAWQQQQVSTQNRNRRQRPKQQRQQREQQKNQYKQPYIQQQQQQQQRHQRQHGVRKRPRRKSGSHRSREQVPISNQLVHQPLRNFPDDNSLLSSDQPPFESSQHTTDNDLSGGMSTYSDWNFAPASSMESPEVSTQSQSQSQLVEDSWITNMSMSAGETWLTNVPKQLVYSSLDCSSVRSEMNMSGWPIRDMFVIGLSRHFGSVVVSLNLSGSVHLSDKGVASILKGTCGTLQSLNLSGCWRITEKGFEKQKTQAELSQKNRQQNNSVLVELKLSSLPHLDDLVVRTLVSSPYTCRVRRLSMCNCPLLSDAGFGVLKGMKHLTAVHIDGCRGVRGNTFRNVLEKCHYLIELTASGLPMLSDDAVRAIAARKASFGYTGGTNGVLELRLLNFSKCHRLTDISLQWLASKLMNIRAINFSGCPLISDASLNMIARSCPQLASLSLKGCARITDVSLVFLAQCLAEHNRHRKDEDCEPASTVSASVIIPHGAGIYDDLPESGKAAGKPVGLTELDLSCCGRVSDAGIRALANVSKNLRSLRLNNVDGVGNAGLQYIAKRCTQLERIELSGNPRLTDVGVRNILKKVRRCTLEGSSIGIGKYAVQSTTLAGRHASFAVNGNASGYYGISYDDENGQVSHTCQEPNPWLIIDLGVITDISFVRVVGAAESGRYRQNYPLWVMASELPFDELNNHGNTDKDKDNAEDNATETVDLPGADIDCERLCGTKVRFSEASRISVHAFDRPARYLRVQTEGSGPLILAELQVYIRGTESLMLSGCHQLTNETALNISQYFVHLHHLDLSGCNCIGDEGVINIIKECERLKTLLLSGCIELSNDSMSALVKKSGKPSKLEVLGISNCSNITDKGILCMATCCPHLSKLQMEDLPRMTLFGVRCLVRCCPLLEAVTLTSSQTMRYNDVKKVMSSLRLATPFDMGNVVGCEPRSDIASLRLAHKISVQQEGLRKACQAVQRTYRRLKAVQRERLGNQLVVDSSVEDALAFVDIPNKFDVLDSTFSETKSDIATNNESGKDAVIVSSFPNRQQQQQRQSVSSEYSESSDFYKNSAMFDIARAESKQRREELARILNLIGKPPRARTIQRCWRTFYAKKVAELKAKLRGRRMTNAVKIIVKLQAIIRGIRIRKIEQARRSKKRVEKVLSDMKSGKVSLQTKGLRPAIIKEIASIIIQRNARIKIARLLIANIKLNLMMEDKSFDIIRRALLRKVARLRGQIMLQGIRDQFREASALRIQSAWRIYCSRKGVLDMRNARAAIESAARAAAQRKLVGKRGMASRRIQKLARSYIELQRIRDAVLLSKQIAAANIIRRSYIRKCARKMQAKMKILLRMEVRKQVLGAKAIQAWYRRRMEVHHMRIGMRLLMLRHVGAAIVVQRWLRFYVRPLVLARLGRSAILIQHMYKHHVFRKKVEKMLRRKRLYRELEREEWEEWYEMEAMALRIQMAWRLRAGRKALRMAKQEKQRMEAHSLLIDRMNQMQNAMRAFERRAKRKHNSIVIQCSIRCALARRELANRKRKKLQKEHAAVLKLQYRLRSMIAMKMMALLRKQIEEKLAKEEEAMTAQQKFQRWQADKAEALKHQLQVGDVVKSRWMGKHKAYPGVITRINPPGDWLEGESYEVLYQDGFLERRAERVWIRFQSRNGEENTEDSEGKTDGTTTKTAPVKHIDPVEASFAIIDDAEEKRSRMDKFKSWIPFTNSYKTRQNKLLTKKKLSKTQGQHAVFTKQRTSAKIRVGIDDIRIIMGDLANMTMEAEQRTTTRRKQPPYIKIDVDLRQRIRFETDDPMSVFIWYRKSTKPRLIVDIKILHGWEKGHKQWAVLREKGYEKVISNTVQPPEDMPTMWTRLPMTIWYKKHVYETPIKELMFSRSTQTRAQEISLLQEGYFQNVQDLKLFGLDHGLQMWMRRAEKFDDAIKVLADTKGKLNKKIRDLHDVPPDIHPRAVALKHGADDESMDIIDEIVSYLNMKDKDVKKMYKGFCHLANKQVNQNGDVRVSLDELCHHGLGFEYGAKELGTILYSLLDLAKVKLIDKEFLDFPQYLRLLAVVCVLDTDQMMRFFFNLADTLDEGMLLSFLFLLIFGLVWIEIQKVINIEIKFGACAYLFCFFFFFFLFFGYFILFFIFTGYADIDGIVALIWELHAESNEYRKGNMSKVIKKAILSDKAKKKWTRNSGGGKVSWKMFRLMSQQIPSMLYPMFNFSYKLCVISLGIPWWESKKKYFSQQRKMAKKEFDDYEKQLFQEKQAQFGSNLSAAVLQDTVKAMLAGAPLPPDADASTIEDAKARVKKIQRKAAKMGVNAATTGKKKKASAMRQKEEDVDVDVDSGDE
tara:strand:- start:459 stop:7646 length:7188 start_codon:yes stop_codon:yes gene_type:complete